MPKAPIHAMVLLLALGGCGGESRIEAPEGGSGGGEPAERAEGPAEVKKSSPDVARPRKSADTETAKAGAAPAVKKEAGKAKDPAAAPAKPAKPAARKSTQGIPSDVAAIIADLKRDGPSARKAFLRIWEIPQSVIPRLIEQVENTETSQLESIEILVLDPDFLRPGDMKPFLANSIHGLGRMETLDETNKDDVRIIAQEYTTKAYGITANRHYKVKLEKFGGFPIGVVIRAGLINRLKSTHYPPSSDDDPEPGMLIAWWRDFYGLARRDMDAAK
jgi:hypothetical protein